MTKTHTPGPWKTDKSGVNVLDPRERVEYVIAFCKGSTLQEVQSNARLIAAAPSMLLALETAWMALGGIVNRNECVQNAMDKCQEALSLARNP